MKIRDFGVESWLNNWEKKAAYDISQSTISSLTMDKLFALCKDDPVPFFKQLSGLKMNYGWIEGSPEFKQAVAARYRQVVPQQILQTNGASGANNLAFYSLIKPGDHIISEYPSYQQLYDIPQSLGAQVDYWRIRAENQWQPDLTELAAMITPHTKMICLNNANNPTETLLSRPFLKQVVELAKKVNAYVLVDEVYHPLVKTADCASIVDLYSKGIAVDSLSKSWSLPGLRIGWIIADKKTSDVFRKYRDYTMISAGVLNDAIAVYALQHTQQIWLRNQQIVQDNLKIFLDWVQNEPRAQVVAPKFVSVSCVHLDIPVSTEYFCKELLVCKGGLLVPGERFDLPGYVRLGYCADRKVLIKGLSLLSEFLRQYD